MNAHDPVALYLSEASAARARVAAARARQAEAAKLRRLPKVSPIFATVMVVVALLVGIEIGHSSSSSSSSGSRVVTTSSSTTTTTTTKPSGTGGSAVDKVEKSKGKSYVQQENDLPTSVSP